MVMQSTRLLPFLLIGVDPDLKSRGLFFTDTSDDRA